MHLTDLYCVPIYVTSHWIWRKRSVSFVKKRETWPQIKRHQLRKGETEGSSWLNSGPDVGTERGEKTINKPTPSLKVPRKAHRAETTMWGTHKKQTIWGKALCSSARGWDVDRMKMQITARLLVRTCSGLQREGAQDRGSYLMFMIFCLLISVMDLGSIKDRWCICTSDLWHILVFNKFELTK